MSDSQITTCEQETMLYTLFVHSSSEIIHSEERHVWNVSTKITFELH